MAERKSSGTYIIDEKYNIVNYNQTAEDIYPMLKGSRGKKCYQVLMNGDAPCASCPVRNNVKGPRTYMDPIRHINETVDAVEMPMPDGSTGHALIFATVPVNDGTLDLKNGRKKILVVSQKEETIAEMTDILSDYDVMSARTAMEGIAFVNTHYHLLSAVLLETDVTTNAGPGFIQTLKTDLLTSFLPVIAIVDKPDRDVEKKFLKAGVLEFMLKPFDPAIIQSRLHNVLKMNETVISLQEIERDPLTGLYGRPAFYRYGRQYLDKDPEGDYIICITDVENFKMVNTIYGEKKADEVLKYMASYFDGITTDGICCRYNSDQFITIARNKEERNLDWLLNMVRDVSKNAPIPNLNIKTGIYDHIDTSLSMSEICDRALLAVKSVKHNYSASYAYYEGEVSQKAYQAKKYEAAFPKALKEKQFTVFYQPKYDPYTEKIIGAEALVRWIRDGKIIPPGEFLPVFEDDGLISQLDEYVFRSVCQLQKKWNDYGIALIPISINLSRRSMHQADVVERYASIVHEAGIPFSAVPIEITESAATESEEIKPLVDSLSKAGFKLHMDDFGSGQSSLGSLNILHFDVIKLDKSLVDFIGNQQGDKVLMYTIALAKELGMKLVAEGVENKKQLSFLMENGCDAIQGFYFARPMPLSDFEAVSKYSIDAPESNHISRRKRYVLSELADYDALTHIYSRSFMESRIRECTNSSRKGIFSVLLFDVDDLKTINDTYDYEAGDHVLQHVARKAVELSDRKDYAGRWGSDEFVILFPDTDQNAALEIAQNLREAVTYEKPDNITKITISGGLITLPYGSLYSESYHRIDQALYHARKNGGNQITIYTSSISDEAEAEAHQKNFRDKPQAEYEHMPFPLVVYEMINDVPNVLAISEGFCEMLHVSKEKALEYLASRNYSRIHPDDVELLRTAINAANADHPVIVTIRMWIQDTWHRILITERIAETEEGRQLAFASYTDLETTEKAIGSSLDKYRIIQNETCYRDSLTGLLNLEYLSNTGKGILHNIITEEKTPAVIMMDIRGMHAYNIRYGYEAGDALLQKAAAILRDTLENDIVARFIDDAFIIITTRSSEEIRQKFNLIENRLVQETNGTCRGIKAGLYICLGKNENFNDAVDKARLALRYAKRVFTNVFVYNEEVAAVFGKEEYILNHFDEALNRKWIQPVIQPLISMKTGRTAAYEMIARWDDPIIGSVHADELIEILEKHNLTHKLDLYICRQVCLRLERLLHNNQQNLVPFHLNISVKDLLVPGFLDQFLTLLTDSTIPAQLIQIELAQSTRMINDPEIHADIEKLKQHGFGIWLDHYDQAAEMEDTSLFEGIKIDIRTVSEDMKETIRKQAENHHITWAAINIETRGQYESAVELGFALGQGNYIAVPSYRLFQRETAGNAGSLHSL